MEEKKLRYLPDVIIQMVEAIPGDQEQLLDELENIQSSASYASPETIGHWWMELSLTMQQHFPDGVVPIKAWHDWQVKVVDILQGNTEWRTHLVSK